MAEETKRIVKFKETVEGDELHVGVGTYTGLFQRSAQPFAVTPEEWAYLSSTHQFELDAAAEAARQKVADDAEAARQKAADDAAKKAVKQTEEK